MSTTTDISFPDDAPTPLPPPLLYTHYRHPPQSSSAHAVYNAASVSKGSKKEDKKCLKGPKLGGSRMARA